MNYLGQVIAVATAFVQESQGISFTVSSDTIVQNIIEIMNDG